MWWVAIILDGKKYGKQYEDAYHNFVDETCHQQWKKIVSKVTGSRYDAVTYPS